MTVLFERITKICDKRNLSLYAVEKGAELSDSSLRKWENTMPSWDKILRVANFLDVSIDYLLGNCDNPDSHKNPIVLSEVVEEINLVLSDYFNATLEAKDRLVKISSLSLSPNKSCKKEN